MRVLDIQYQYGLPVVSYNLKTMTVYDLEMLWRSVNIQLEKSPENEGELLLLLDRIEYEIGDRTG